MSLNSNSSSARTIFIILLLSSIVSNAFSQVDFTINKISVSNIIVITDSIYDKSKESGPLIDVVCDIYNRTDKPIIIDIQSGSVYVSYVYNKNQYEKEIESNYVGYVHNGRYVEENADKITLMPNDSSSIYFQTRYFVDNLKTKKLPVVDYTEETISTLPTLKVIYKDKDINMVSSGIQNVTIDNFVYNLSKHKRK